MKRIKRTLPFTTKYSWAWPDEDEKLVQVFEHVTDIDYIMQFVPKRAFCLQAGGACGVWPFRFAHYFDQVYTFEPMIENYQCLVENIEGIENIKPFNYALSYTEQFGSMVWDRSEHNNYGACYFEFGKGHTQAIRIDDLQLNDCDLIQLDIEGHELQALKGAKATIERFEPVIVLEEKPLKQLKWDHDEPRKYLANNFGYMEVGRIHKDVIFKC